MDRTSEARTDDRARTTDSRLILYLPNGPEHAGHLLIPLPDEERMSVWIYPSKARVLIALAAAVSADSADPNIPPEAKGWRSAKQLSSLIDEHEEWKLYLEPRTVRDYISNLHIEITRLAEAAGVTAPSLFDRRPRVGIRLAYTLDVIDKTADAGPTD